jgi:SPFH domain/Band 7 family protein
MLAGVMILIVARSVVLVPQGVAYVVERMGHFDRVLGPGLHILLPFVHKVVDKMAIGQQSLSIPAMQLTTRDGVAIKVGGSARFDVTDPELAYEAMEFRTALVQLVASEWMRTVETATAADVSEALKSVESRIRNGAVEWGLNVMRATPTLTFGGDQPTRVEPAPEPVALPAPAAAEEAIVTSTSAEPSFSSVFPTPPSDGIRFAVASGTIAPGALGLVELDGKQWTARNLSASEIPRGFRCVVERQDGETLLVRCV